MSTVTFTPVAVAPASRENATRERKPARLVRAKQMFSIPKGVEFLGPVELPAEAIAALGSGNIVNILGNPVSKGKPGILACAICQGVHGSTEGFHARADLVAKTTLYRTMATKVVFSLSDTCRVLYFGEYASKALVNPVDYLSYFPKSPVR